MHCFWCLLILGLPESRNHRCQNLGNGFPGIDQKFQIVRGHRLRKSLHYSLEKSWTHRTSEILGGDDAWVVMESAVGSLFGYLDHRYVLSTRDFFGILGSGLWGKKGKTNAKVKSERRKWRVKGEGERWPILTFLLVLCVREDSVQDMLIDKGPFLRMALSPNGKIRTPFKGWRVEEVKGRRIYFSVDFFPSSEILFWLPGTF